MKINSVSESTFYKVNQNRNVVRSNKQPVSDCFVRSNNVSFSGLSLKDKRDVTTNSFIKDLTSKLWAVNFSINDISNSMRKYIKNISVKPMSQAPKEHLFSKNLQGLYYEELAFDDSNNRVLIPKKNRVFYTRTEKFKTEGGNIFAAVNAVHEFTHALQSEDSSINQIDLFNSYIDKNKDDIDTAFNQISGALSTVHVVEENIIRPFMTILTNNENIALERMNSGYKDLLSWLCRKNKTEDFSEYVKEQTSAGIETVEKEQGIILDKGLVLDTLINHFKKEIEAYSNENKAYKQWVGIDCADSLVRVQMYQKSIDVLSEMRKEVI